MIKKIAFILFFAITVINASSWAAVKTEGSCVSCHKDQGGSLSDPVIKWQESIHKEKGVGCQDCHGGNPNSLEDAMSKSAGFVGAPSPAQVPAFCAKCHSDPKKMSQYRLRTDQYELYKTSVHGKRLLQLRDTNVATCVSCHGSHDIKSPRNSASPAYRTNVPKTCAKCHSNHKLMSKYGIPSNQFEEYKQSYHGQQLLENNNLNVANCADCHGNHGATPPGVKEVANVCGNCHALTEDYYNRGPHKAAVERTGRPRCIDCHGNHKITFPDAAMFIGQARGRCGSCHRPASKAYKTAQFFHSLISSFEARVKKSQAAISDLKSSGIDLNLLEEQAKEINAKVIETIPLTHTQREDLVSKKIEEGVELLSQVQNGIVKIKAEAGNRRKIFLGVIVVILTLVFLLYLKLRSLSKE